MNHDDPNFEIKFPAAEGNSNALTAEQEANIRKQLEVLGAKILDGQHFVDQSKAHLGGYIKGGDAATYYPDLWKWMVNKLGIKKVVDVGCGEGHALKFFRDELGCDVMGIDGLPQEDEDTSVHDFTDGPCHAPECDLIWCCEFVEHVEERFMLNFLTTFRYGKYVALTHAEPGQSGHHHVNCKHPQYWIGAMAAIGFKFDDILTKCARIAASSNANVFNHFKRSGLVFVRY